jgi:hypothetical protein
MPKMKKLLPILLLLLFTSGCVSISSPKLLKTSPQVTGATVLGFPHTSFGIGAHFNLAQAALAMAILYMPSGSSDDLYFKKGYFERSRSFDSFQTLYSTPEIRALTVICVPF